MAAQEEHGTTNGGKATRRGLLGLLAGSGATLAAFGLRRVTSPGTPGHVASAQETPAVVRAQRFELVDGNGTVRAAISMSQNGPIVALLDESGHARALMAQNPEGEYGFGVNDAQGTARFGVGTTKRGFVGLGMKDANGTFRANMQVADDGSWAGFRTADEHDQQRTFLGLLNDRPGYGIEVEDATGQVLWQAP